MAAYVRGQGFKTKNEVNTKLDTYNSKNVEDRVKSLMYEILNARKELRVISIRVFSPYESIQDLKQEGEALQQKILFLCHELQTGKSMLIQGMRAMGRNARKLEGQPLDDQDAKQKLMRAARAAWNEVERLGKLIKEIDEVLNQAEEVMAESVETLAKKSTEQDTSRSNKREPRLPYPRMMRPGISTLPNDQSPPRLGSAGSSDLETSLSKIPAASISSMNNVYPGRMEEKIRSPMAMESRTGPRMDQAGFNGSYVAGDSSRATGNFQSDVIGDW